MYIYMTFKKIVLFYLGRRSDIFFGCIAFFIIYVAKGFIFSFIFFVI